MASRGPITLTLPPFSGVTRQVVLTVLGVYFGLLVLGLFLPELAALLVNLGMLHPEQALHHLLWQLLTYPFISQGLFGLLLALLSFWFFGAALEEERGARWYTEFLVVSSVGGGVLASVLALLLGRFVPEIGPGNRASGLWPLVLALLVAFAVFHANEEISFNFIFRLKAKYLAAIYLLLYMALSFVSGERFSAVLALSNAFCGYAFAKLAPRTGVRRATAGSVGSLREARLRWGRRRAARKFTVYMKKQGREVNLDPEGRYIDPDKRDDKDYRWKN